MKASLCLLIFEVVEDFPDGSKKNTANDPKDPTDAPTVGSKAPGQVSGCHEQPVYSSDGAFQRRLLAGGKVTFPQKPLHASPLHTNPDKQTYGNADKEKHCGKETGSEQRVDGKKT